MPAAAAGIHGPGLRGQLARQGGAEHLLERMPNLVVGHLFVGLHAASVSTRARGIQVRRGRGY
jgi:hypothetical protein